MTCFIKWFFFFFKAFKGSLNIWEFSGHRWKVLYLFLPTETTNRIVFLIVPIYILLNCKHSLKDEMFALTTVVNSKNILFEASWQENIWRTDEGKLGQIFFLKYFWIHSELLFLYQLLIWILFTHSFNLSITIIIVNMKDCELDEWLF